MKDLPKEFSDLFSKIKKPLTKREKANEYFRKMGMLNIIDRGEEERG